MKRFLPLAILFLCISCLTEEGADPGKSKTFFRYYNGGYDDEAKAFEETSKDGGFIILATTQVTGTSSKIKLLKTDRYGNRVWQTLFPSFSSTDPASYTGRGILIEKNTDDEVTGYVIVGDSIIANVPYLYVQRVNGNGEDPVGRAISSLSNVEGISIAKDNDGFLVLGTKRNDPQYDMVLARLKNDLSLDWYREYGAGKTTDITSLYNDPVNQEIFWGGTVTLNNDQPTDIRFIKTKPMNESTVFSPNFGEPSFNEVTGGICYSEFGSSFNLVGTTDVSGSLDIIYKRVNRSGTQENSVLIGDEDNDEAGNAIWTTNDNGSILIATAGTGELSDYYLIKLNYFGDVMWSTKFGSNKNDVGVSVRQTTDGSYVVLGTTLLGGRKTIMLSKRNSTGNIE
jgi:hypothetical protein